jgi:hypothetical protein
VSLWFNCAFFVSFVVKSRRYLCLLRFDLCTSVAFIGCGYAALWLCDEGPFVLAVSRLLPSAFCLLPPVQPKLTFSFVPSNSRLIK